MSSSSRRPARKPHSSLSTAAADDTRQSTSSGGPSRGSKGESTQPPAKRKPPSSASQSSAKRPRIDDADTNHSIEPVYCVCRQPNTGDPMIECDDCGEWYHFRCIGMTANEAAKIDHYICDRCSIKDKKRANATTTNGRQLRRRVGGGGLGAGVGAGESEVNGWLDDGDGTGKWISKIATTIDDSDEDDEVYMTSDDDSGSGGSRQSMDYPKRRQPEFTRTDYSVNPTIVDIDAHHHSHSLSFRPSQHCSLLRPTPLTFSSLFEECQSLLLGIRRHPNYKLSQRHRLSSPSIMWDTYQRYQCHFQSLSLLYQQLEYERHMWLTSMEWTVQQTVNDSNNVTNNDNDSPMDDGADGHYHGSSDSHNDRWDTLLSEALPLGIGHQRFHADAQEIVTKAQKHAIAMASELAQHSGATVPPSPAHSSLPLSLSLNPRLSIASPSSLTLPPSPVAPTPSRRQRSSLSFDDSSIMENVSMDILHCIGCRGYIPVGDYADHIETCSIQAPQQANDRLLTLLPYSTVPPPPSLPSLTLSSLSSPSLSLRCHDDAREVLSMRDSEWYSWRPPTQHWIHFASLPMLDVKVRDTTRLAFARREIAIKQLREEAKENETVIDERKIPRPLLTESELDSFLAQPRPNPRHWASQVDLREPLAAGATPSDHTDNYMAIPTIEEPSTQCPEFVQGVTYKARKIRPFKFESRPHGFDCSWDLPVPSLVRYHGNDSRSVSDEYRLITPSLLPSMRCGYPLYSGSDTRSLTFTHCLALRSQCDTHREWELTLKNKIETSLVLLNRELESLSYGLTSYRCWFDSIRYRQNPSVKGIWYGGQGRWQDPIKSFFPINRSLLDDKGRDSGTGCNTANVANVIESETDAITPKIKKPKIADKSNRLVASTQSASISEKSSRSKSSKRDRPKERDKSRDSKKESRHRESSSSTGAKERERKKERKRDKNKDEKRRDRERKRKRDKERGKGSSSSSRSKHRNAESSSSNSGASETERSASDSRSSDDERDEPVARTSSSADTRDSHAAH